jgi:hypothetical protein
MGRIACFVPALPRFKSQTSLSGRGFVRGRNFDRDDVAFSARSNNYTSGAAEFDMPLGPSWDTNGNTYNYETIYYFMRFKVLRYPTAAAALLNFYYRSTVSIEFHFDINTNGTITAYNDAGTANPVATTAVATLGQWITLYGRITGSRTNNNVGGMSMFFNGTQVYNNFLPGTLPGPGVGLNSFAASALYRCDTPFGIVSNVGFEMDLDQLLLDDTDAITSASRFTPLRVTANGTFTTWTSSAGTISNDWKYRNQDISQMVDTGISFPFANSSVNGEESSWVCQTLRQAGVTQGWKTAIIIHDTVNATNARHFYLRNGVQTLAVTPVGAPADDWDYSLLDATSWGLDDALEVGVRCLGGTGRCGYLQIWVEHTTPFVAPTDGTVTIQRINYTGNGAGAAGALEVTLPFEPTFFIVAPRTGTGNVYFWSKSQAYILGFNDTIKRGSYTYGTRLILGANDFNANAVVYDVLCIKDYTQRMVGYDTMYQMDQTVPFDTDNEQLITILPAPFAVWSNIENNGFVNAQGFMMGPGQAANASLQFEPPAALTANILETLNATGVIIHRGRYANAAGCEYPFTTFVPTGFGLTRLYDIFTYTGDGTANRVVPLTNFPSNTPVWVMIFPHNNSARYMRNNQQSNALRLDTGATDATAIANFATGQFTVNGTTNTNGILFTVFVFIEGSDAAPSNQYSGIYYLDPTARHDTLWDRTGSPVTTNVKIPNPIYRTHFVGDG